MACSETMGSRDAAHKPTWTYSRRVSEQAIASQVVPNATREKIDEPFH